MPKSTESTDFQRIQREALHGIRLSLINTTLFGILHTVSPGEMAFTLVDVDSPIEDRVIDAIAAIEGVLSVRSIPATDEVS